MNKIFLVLLGVLLVSSFVSASLYDNKEDIFEENQREFYAGMNYILENYEYYGDMDVGNVPCLATVDNKGYIAKECNASCVKSCLYFVGTNEEIECLYQCAISKVSKEDSSRKCIEMDNSGTFCYNNTLSGFQENYSKIYNETYNRITYNRILEVTTYKPIWLEKYNYPKESWYQRLISKITKFLSSEEDSSTEELREYESWS